MKEIWGMDSLTELSDLCNRIANIAIKDENHMDTFCRELGCGYLVLVNKMLSGVAAVAEMRKRLAAAELDIKLAKKDRECVRQILDDLLGDRDIDTWSDEYYGRIKDFMEEKGVKDFIAKLGEEEQEYD